MATFTGIGKLLKDVVFSDLTTSAKNIIGAINELNTGRMVNDYALVTPDSIIKSALYVDLNNKYGEFNRKYILSQASSGTKFSDLPTSISNIQCILMRDVYWISSVNILVRMTEYFPVVGRTWYNQYNSGVWTGWVFLNPQ